MINIISDSADDVKVREAALKEVVQRILLDADGWRRLTPKVNLNRNTLQETGTVGEDFHVRESASSLDDRIRFRRQEKAKAKLTESDNKAKGAKLTESDNRAIAWRYAQG